MYILHNVECYGRQNYFFDRFFLSLLNVVYFSGLRCTFVFGEAWGIQVRFPNCLECPVASVLGNLTITQVASAGGADESSSKKVKATMRMLLRREVRRHTLISVGQRGRGRHLLSEGLSPKVGG